MGTHQERSGTQRSGHRIRLCRRDHVGVSSDLQTPDLRAYPRLGDCHRHRPGTGLGRRHDDRRAKRPGGPDPVFRHRADGRRHAAGLRHRRHGLRGAGHGSEKGRLDRRDRAAVGHGAAVYCRRVHGLGLRLPRCGEHDHHRRRCGDLHCRAGDRRGHWRQFRCGGAVDCHRSDQGDSGDGRHADGGALDGPG
ncbi:hypothetical protein D3C73_1191300 [compost metagenome]